MKFIQFGTNNAFSEDHVISAKGLSLGSFCTRVLTTSACMQAIRSALLVPCIALLLIQIDRSLYFKSIAKVANG